MITVNHLYSATFCVCAAIMIASDKLVEAWVYVGAVVLSTVLTLVREPK